MTSPLEQARYIHDTGVLIHERIFRIQARQMAAGPHPKGMANLSMQQLYTLTAIWHRRTVSVTELASVMGVSPPSASAMVERLVEKNLVSREPDPADRRKVVVKVTPLFEASAEKVEAAIMKTFVDIVQKIGPDAARQWCEVLAGIKGHLIEDVHSETKKENS
jgi:DNA-binding MarR family transcriptional regulator